MYGDGLISLCGIIWYCVHLLYEFTFYGIESFQRTITWLNGLYTCRYQQQYNGAWSCIKFSGEVLQLILKDHLICVYSYETIRYIMWRLGYFPTPKASTHPHTPEKSKKEKNKIHPQM